MISWLPSRADITGYDLVQTGRESWNRLIVSKITVRLALTLSIPSLHHAGGGAESERGGGGGETGGIGIRVDIPLWAQLLGCIFANLKLGPPSTASHHTIARRLSFSMFFLHMSAKYGLS